MGIPAQDAHKGKQMTQLHLARNFALPIDWGNRG